MKNLQILIGNLGADPKVVKFDNGDQVAKFSLATSETWKDKQSGEVKTNTQWHHIIAQKQLSTVAERFLKKGSKVYIEGVTRHRSYISEGNERNITEVYVRDLKLLSPHDKETTPLDNMKSKNNNTGKE